MCIRDSTHTHTHTNTHTRTHTHKHTCAHTHTHAHTRTHEHTHAYRNTHTHVRTHIHCHSHARSRAQYTVIVSTGMRTLKIVAEGCRGKTMYRSRLHLCLNLAGRANLLQPALLAKCMPTFPRSKSHLGRFSFQTILNWTNYHLYNSYLGQFPFGRGQTKAEE